MSKTDRVIDVPGIDPEQPAKEVNRARASKARVKGCSPCIDQPVEHPAACIDRSPREARCGGHSGDRGRHRLPRVNAPRFREVYLVEADVSAYVAGEDDLTDDYIEQMKRGPGRRRSASVDVEEQTSKVMEAFAAIVAGGPQAGTGTSRSLMAWTSGSPRMTPDCSSWMSRSTVLTTVRRRASGFLAPQLGERTANVLECQSRSSMACSPTSARESLTSSKPCPPRKAYCSAGLKEWRELFSSGRKRRMSREPGRALGRAHRA